MHFLYKITNTLNSKVYIGQAVDIGRRWSAHKSFAKNPEKTGQYIHNAMHKYGIENFTYEVIDFAQNQWQANCIETNLIELYDSRNSEKGYNLLRGGGVVGGKDHPCYGKKQSIEQINKRLESGAWFYNGPKSDEIKNKISQSLIGHTFAPETLQKMSQAKLGKPSWNAGTKGKGIMKANKASFQPGHPAPETAFQKGLIPWNKRLDHAEIIGLKHNGTSIKDLALKFDCAEGTIYRIVKGK